MISKCGTACGVKKLKKSRMLRLKLCDLSREAVRELHLDCRSSSQRFAEIEFLEEVVATHKFVAVVCGEAFGADEVEGAKTFYKFASIDGNVMLLFAFEIVKPCEKCSRIAAAVDGPTVNEVEFGRHEMKIRIKSEDRSA